jgi:hypothetical protein
MVDGHAYPLMIGVVPVTSLKKIYIYQCHRLTQAIGMKIGKSC